MCFSRSVLCQTMAAHYSSEHTRSALLLKIKRNASGRPLCFLFKAKTVCVHCQTQDMHFGHCMIYKVIINPLQKKVPILIQVRLLCPTYSLKISKIHLFVLSITLYRLNIVITAQLNLTQIGNDLIICKNPVSPLNRQR